MSFDWNILPGTGPSADEVESGCYLINVDSWSVGSTQNAFEVQRREGTLSRPEGSRFYSLKMRLMKHPSTPKAWEGLSLTQNWFIGMDHLDENGHITLSDPEAQDPETWRSNLNWDVSKLNKFVKASGVTVDGIHPDDIGEHVRNTQVWVLVERFPRKNDGFGHSCKMFWAAQEEPESTGPKSEAGGTKVRTTTRRRSPAKAKAKAKAGERDCEVCEEKVSVDEYADHLSTAHRTVRT